MMNRAIPILLSGAYLLPIACARREAPLAATQTNNDAPAVVMAQPGEVVSTPDTTIVVAPVAPAPPPVVAVAPSAAPGTIELSGFKPQQEDLRNITRIVADSIEEDESGRFILRGRAVVEITQGVAKSRLTGDYITVQGGPGFSAVIEERNK